jgi:alkanesulfonate monooxygenase SsuD/methylene tetrahydromethanopterin reductase-like flavin-dependent oxidoreductase (luciferase family)
LACQTKRLEFGPLVTPLSFWHPVQIARIAKDIDDLSGGRLVLGVGAGWGGGQREHNIFGFDLLEPPERFSRYHEGLDIIRQLLHNDQPVTFHGHYYQLNGALLLPRPARKGGPPLLVGGNGPKQVLALAARYADEWNGIFRTPAQFAVLNARLDEYLDQLGRPRAAVARSQMKGLIFARTQKELEAKLNGRSAIELWERGYIAGAPLQIADQLEELASVGVSKVMLQWNDLDDFPGLEAFAQSVLVKIQSC